MAKLSKKGRFVYCADCGSRQEINGVCRICGHVDVPILPGIVPAVENLSQLEATLLLTGPEAQLKIGAITNAVDAVVLEGYVISSDPVGGTELPIGSTVDLVISDGPE